VTASCEPLNRSADVIGDREPSVHLPRWPPLQGTMLAWR
jgi:hypothetical protein